MGLVRRSGQFNMLRLSLENLPPMRRLEKAAGLLLEAIFV